jgi:two-component system nitrogen regulation sensor histidine kinase NtrY
MGTQETKTNKSIFIRFIQMFGAFFANLYGYSWKKRSLKLFGRKSSPWTFRFAIILIVAAAISGFATYAALNSLPPFGKDPNTVFWLLNLDLIILLMLVTLTASRIVNVWIGRRKGLAGSKLHVRLVLIFSLLTVTPAILMTIFSAFFLHFGVQSWFSDRVRTAVNESQAVAEAYLSEHQQVIKADVLAAANDLNRQADILVGNQAAFNQIMQTQSMLRNFSETLVFEGSGFVYSRSGITSTLSRHNIPDYLLEQARNGEIVLMTAGDGDRVRALLKLNNFTDAFLFVSRMVDPTVLRHVVDTRKAAKDYEKLEEQRSDFQVTITMIFVVVALLLLFAAIWLGLVLARQIVMPISSMVSAADRVRAGDLSARVPERKRGDEFDVLALSFNRMTKQLNEQREELIMANRQLDQRRRFTETVLAGVSSGVVGVNEKGIITLVNSSAGDLLAIDVADMTGEKIASFLPELKPLLKEAHEKPGKITQSEIVFINGDNSRRILLVRIAIETIGDKDNGAVITFDDITELQSAQRKAAWADVARRIAHEIKNPLTPIQLSAERLKKKYLNQIDEDQEIFSQCTDTIIHHVSDIGRMVNEFSAFARMPEPVMKNEDLVLCIKHVLTLQEQAHPDIKIDLKFSNKEAENILARFDSRQVRQAFTNILQNAIDSIHGKIKSKPSHKGRLDIIIGIREAQQEAFIALTDNGLGLPEHEDPSRLTEPYVTHREKGTGLGLAIVKKILEDHGGRFVIGTPQWLKENSLWKSRGGATVILVFPLDGIDSEGNIENNELKKAS